LTKTRAFLLHFFLSAAIFGALLVVLVRRWFPLPYFVADGGWQGLRLVTAVDLTLGPLLTLVVYKKWKPRKKLAFDYTVIGLLQALALGYGIWTVAAQRTTLVAFSDGTFYTVDTQTAATTGPRARSLMAAEPALPAYASVSLPEDPGKLQEIRKTSLKQSRPLYMFDELLGAFDERALRAAEPSGRRVMEVLRNAPESRRAIEQFLSKSGGRQEDFVFLPVTGRYRNLLLAFRRPKAPSPPQVSGKAVAPADYLWVDVAQALRQKPFARPRKDEATPRRKAG
jgi:hypothetical protein